MEVKNLLKAHHLRPKMMKYIFAARGLMSASNPELTVVYADDEELAAMEVCHPRCIEILENFLESLPKRAAHRAIDVAGGDGRLSTSFLQNLYRKVDLFDGCPLAVSRAKEAMSARSNFGYAEEAYMETFKWRFYYSAIFMVWCVGYLERDKLVAFLRVAKSRLMPHPGRMNRSSLPDSFLIVFDNVLEEGAESRIIKR